MKSINTYYQFLSVLIGTGFLLASCSFNETNLKQLTSLSIDCKTEEIHISDDTIDLNEEESWTAKCKGKTYFCNYLDGDDLGCYEVVQ